LLAIPDKELVVRLLADDVAAFDALYHKYSQPLYANIFKPGKVPKYNHNDRGGGYRPSLSYSSMIHFYQISRAKSK
jgi:hypothetical protein